MRPFFSLDHLIRSRQHVRRNRQADLLGGFQIDDELKLRRLLESATRRALRPLGSCPRNWPHAAEGRKEVAASATPLHRGGLNDTIFTSGRRVLTFCPPGGHGQRSSRN